MVEPIQLRVKKHNLSTYKLLCITWHISNKDAFIKNYIRFDNSTDSHCTCITSKDVFIVYPPDATMKFVNEKIPMVLKKIEAFLEEIEDIREQEYLESCMKGDV